MHKLFFKTGAIPGLVNNHLRPIKYPADHCIKRMAVRTGFAGWHHIRSRFYNHGSKGVGIKRVRVCFAVKAYTKYQIIFK